MVIIYRGEDKIISFTLTDGDDAPLIINDLTGIIVLLYHQHKVIARYSIHPLTGYGPITTVDSNGGIISLMLTAEVTRNAPLGKLRAEIKVRITPSDTFDSIAVAELADIEEARSRNETTFL